MVFPTWASLKIYSVAMRGLLYYCYYLGWAGKGAGVNTFQGSGRKKAHPHRSAQLSPRRPPVCRGCSRDRRLIWESWA